MPSPRRLARFTATALSPRQWRGSCVVHAAAARVRGRWDRRSRRECPPQAIALSLSGSTTPLTNPLLFSSVMKPPLLLLHPECEPVRLYSASRNTFTTRAPCFSHASPRSSPGGSTFHRTAPGHVHDRHQAPAPPRAAPPAAAAVVAAAAAAAPLDEVSTSSRSSLLILEPLAVIRATVMLFVIDGDDDGRCPILPPRSPMRTLSSSLGALLIYGSIVLSFIISFVTADSTCLLVDMYRFPITEKRSHKHICARVSLAV